MRELTSGVLDSVVWSVWSYRESLELIGDVVTYQVVNLLCAGLCNPVCVEG